MEFHRDKHRRLITIKTSGRDFASPVSPASLERNNPVNLGDATGADDEASRPSNEMMTREDMQRPLENKQNKAGDASDAKTHSLSSSWLAPGLTAENVRVPWDDEVDPHQP
jgi:hypothetical protein